MISFGRKVYSQKSLKNLSELLINLFLPVYAIIEVSRMATPANMGIFWIMIISVILSMTLGYYSGKILQYLFKTDVRIHSSFNLLCCVPSVGTLPLVLGRAFCFPGGPLEGDPQCLNILGYMMINYLVFQIGLFLIGFSLIAKDANFGYEIGDKMSLTWHIICEKLFMKNYYVLFMFRRFLKDKKLAQNLFEKFDANNKLIRKEGELNPIYINLDKDESMYYSEKDKLKENAEINYIISNEDFIKKKTGEQLDPNNIRLNEDYIKNFIESIGDSCRKNLENNVKLLKIKYKNNDLNSDRKPDSTIGNYVVEPVNEEREIEREKLEGKYYFSESRRNSLVDNIKKEIFQLKNELVSREEPEKMNYVTEFHQLVPILKVDDEGNMNVETGMKRKMSSIIFENSSGYHKNNFQSDRYDDELFIKNFNRSLFRQQSVAIQIQKNQFINLTLDNQEEKIHENIHNFLINRKKSEKIEPDLKADHDIFVPQESMKNLRMNKEEMLKKKKRFNEIILENNKITSMRLQRHQSIFDPSIVNYYQKLFRIIDKNIDTGKRDEFLVEISEVMKNLHDIPPKFPIVKGIEINRDNLLQVEEIWKDYLVDIKKLNNEFELHSNQMAADISLIINKIHSPAVTGTILGLLIGVSGMRDVLFSSNHYISNLVEGILVLTKATVPFLYVSVGISFVTVKGLNLGIPVNKKHIIISFIVRFIIMPGVGLLWTWIWATFYGGIIRESRVFRISLFIPFCVPSSANMVVIVNIIKYFVEEANIILVYQNISLLIILTILYVIYFVAIGSFL